MDDPGRRGICVCIITFTSYNLRYGSVLSAGFALERCSSAECADNVQDGVFVAMGMVI
jgi:hypothetical protein